jgi:hypothetical protein
MKKFLLFIILAATLTPNAYCEAIKLKNGMIINGSIVGQTEYILNVQTSYGAITINQREVEKIMPDLHRVILKGGGEFIGTVLDLDQFNLSLKTDNGVVNIDVAQIASMEVYDYNEAEKQKQYVEKKAELEQQAVSAVTSQGVAATAMETKTAAAEAGSSISQGGLAFDSDLETVFPSKPEVVEPSYVYNYRVHNNEDKPAAEEKIEPLPGEAAAKEEITAEEQIKQKDIGKNYFGLNAGMLNTPLSLDLSAFGGKADADVGGSNVSFGFTYMRRLSQRFWLGGNLLFGFVPKTHFNGLTVDGQTDVAMKTSGQIYEVNLLSNFYINPKSKTRVYLTSGAGYSILSLDGNTAYFSTPGDPNTLTSGKDVSFSSSSPSVLLGIGVERTIQDINIGLEVRGKYTSYQKELKESSNTSIFASIKVSWFF